VPDFIIPVFIIMEHGDLEDFEFKFVSPGLVHRIPEMPARGTIHACANRHPSEL
jgi:hypothetical protein